MSTAVPIANLIESTIVDLVGLSSLTSSVIESSLNGDADFRKKLYGSSELYHITDDTANGIMHGVLKIDADLRGLLDRISKIPPSARQPEPPAALPAKTPIDNMRTDWGDAVAQMVQALSWRQQDVIYKLVDMLEDIAIGAMPSQSSPHAAARPAINELCEALQYIRECIGMAAEDSDVPADEYAQQDRASLLLRYWAGDPGTNANDIAEVIAPFTDAPATVTAKAA